MNDGLHFNHMGCQSLAKSFVDRIKKDLNFPLVENNPLM